ncbi:MAG: sialidase family protein [Thermoplasmatota archaeon]
MQSFAAVFAALLVSSAILAGCADAPEPAPEVAQDGVAPRVRLAPPTNVTFAAPTLLGTMQGGAEPSVAAAPDGTLYVTTPLALWRSDDGGATWQDIGTPVCPLAAPACPGLEETEPGMRGGGDADLYVSPDGRLHWLGLFDGENAIPYQVSDDKGMTWSDPIDLAGDDSGDREWITGRADGTLFASWRNFPSSGDATIKSSVSYDGGASWSDGSDVADDTRMGGIAVDPTSKALALAYDPGGNVQVARSFDDGATWTSTEVVTDAAQGQVFPVVAYDTNGTLYLVYAHDPDGAFGAESPAGTNRPLESPRVFLAVSHDKGVSWSEPVQVNPPGTTAWFPWIAAGGQGRIVVTWYQNDLGLTRQTTDEVYVMAGFSLDADYPQPRFSVVRVDPDPVHRGPECRENPGVCNRSFLDFFEVTVTPDGKAFAAWAQDTWPVPRVDVETSVMATGPDLWG